MIAGGWALRIPARRLRRSPMSMRIRLSPSACVAALALLGAIPPTLAQDRRADEPAGQKAGVDVANRVEGRNQILSIKPEGTLVKKGDLVCELDASAFKERLANQEAVIRAAELAEQGAKAAREVAEMAVTEYVDGTYKLEVMAALRDVARTKAETLRAEGRLAALERTSEKGDSPSADVIPARLDLQAAKFSFELAKSRKDVLEKYAKQRMVKKLKGEVETARAEQIAANAAHLRELGKRRELNEQISRCQIYAPIGGRVSYTEPIRDGGMVREGQTLFRILPGDEPGSEPR
jgi:multidrug resistance efflux pump